MNQNSSDNLPYEKIGKNNPICIADEVPFDIPDSWEWCKIKDVFQIIMGQSPKGDSVGLFQNGMEFHQGKIFFSEKYISNSNQSTIAPIKIVEPESILLCVRAPVGKVNITDRELCIGRGLCALKPLCSINIDFLFLLFNAYENIFVKQATGTTFVAITGEIVKKQLIPLPPLKEQKRIVEKYNTILPLLNNYTLLEGKVTKLNDNFPELLKKSILQEAVQGKLVPQDPNDEPASVLLERIREEKQRLIAEGKIKKDKHESVIFKRDNSHYEKQSSNIVCIDDELPFEIPNSWIWERLGSIGETNIGLTYKPSDKTDETGKLVLRSSNIKDGRIVYDDNVFVNCNIPERSLIHKGDLLICVRNGSRNLVGKSAIVDIDNVAFGAFMAKFSSKINLYIKIFLDSPVFRNQLDSVKTETINQITQDMLKKQLIPIPPIEEQKRIVQRVNILFNKISTL